MALLKHREYYNLAKRSAQTSPGPGVGRFDGDGEALYILKTFTKIPETEMAEQEEELLKGLQERNLENTLLKARKVFLWTDVNDESAKAVVTRLLSLDAEDGEKEIVLYV